MIVLSVGKLVLIHGFYGMESQKTIDLGIVVMGKNFLNCIFILGLVCVVSWNMDSGHATSAFTMAGEVLVPALPLEY